jgi:hypothetical protein
MVPSSGLMIIPSSSFMTWNSDTLREEGGKEEYEDLGVHRAALLTSFRQELFVR